MYWAYLNLVRHSFFSNEKLQLFMKFESKSFINFHCGLLLLTSFVFWSNFIAVATQ